MKTDMKGVKWDSESYGGVRDLLSGTSPGFDGIITLESKIVRAGIGSPLPRLRLRNTTVAGCRVSTVADDSSI